MIAALAPRIRFYLHKEFRAAGIWFLSTQRIGGGDLEENGNFLGGKRVAMIFQFCPYASMFST